MPLAPLPQEPGYYLWYTSDFSFLDVGSVRVSQDDPAHHAYLRQEIGNKGADVVDFHLYRNIRNEWLTLYHECRNHKPHVDKFGVPCVDGYKPYDFDWLVNEPLEKPLQIAVIEALTVGIKTKPWGRLKHDDSWAIYYKCAKGREVCIGHLTNNKLYFSDLIDGGDDIHVPSLTLNLNDPDLIKKAQANLSEIIYNIEKEL